MKIGPYAHAYVATEDEYRVLEAEKRALSSIKEKRIRRRQERRHFMEASTSAEGLLYGPGVDDSV